MAEEALEMFVTITALQGARKPVKVQPTATPAELRKQVSEITQIPLAKLRLIYRGKMIKDDDSKQVVKEYNLEKDCVVHCMGAPSPAAAAAGPSETVATSAASTAAAAMPSASAADPLKAAIATMRQSNAPAVYEVAITTLEKVLSNVMSNPMEDKYRKVKKNNAAFQKRLGGVAGGDAAMKATGFIIEQVDGEEKYVMHATPEAWPRLTEAKAKIAEALEEVNNAANRAAPMNVAPNPLGGANSFGGMPDFGAGGMAAAMNNPQMQNAAANLMSHPDALRMMQNNPNLPPGMRESLQQITSNPAMMAQFTRMMSEPNALSQIQNAMSGMPGGMPDAAAFARMQSAMGGQAPPAGGAMNNAAPGAPNAMDEVTDQDQTEEEMIAEAIRRSMDER